MKPAIRMVLSVAASLSLFGAPVAAQTEWQSVIATREGLVGRVTATGHRIRPRDWFVALPSRSALYRRVEVCGSRGCAIAPVLDVGPHYTRDPYWQTGQAPKAEATRPNRAGIDLADGVAEVVGIGAVKWQFVE